jgi:hypothetical protein
VPELEDRLRALGERLDWPPTPDLATAVAERIREERRRPAGRPRPARRRRSRLAIAVAVALLVPAAGALAFPSARDGVLEWLGLKGAEVRRVPELPPAREPDLGRRVSLTEARRLAGFRPLVPSALGPPREVRYEAATGFVTLVHDGVLVAQARGALTRELVEKAVHTTTGVRAVRVGGAAGVFIDGPHTYLYERPGRVIGEDRPRRAGRALVFNRGDVLVRIEGPAQAEALRIARSLR